ncbi:MAG TPA: lytic transglycosylase domain-containing protein [Geobacteraceae bacterium]|nr:lytic transglycosylase domain-containing protein [Geobacteraceae bacterium]
MVNPITGNTYIETDLRETRNSFEENPSLKEGFDKVLTSAIGSIKSENVNTERVKASDMAEIIRLEMMRNSLSVGDANAESRISCAGSDLSLLLKSLQQCANSAPEPDNIQEDHTSGELNGEGHDLAGLDSIIKRASERYHVDAGLIKAVIKAESNFNTGAVSPAGAQGLMQLMPSTAQGLGVTNSFDPVQNVMAGTKFLKQMLDRYDGDINSALAAYNWGPGNLEKRGGMLPRETRDYLIKVKGYYSKYSV